MGSFLKGWGCCALKKVKFCESKGAKVIRETQPPTKTKKRGRKRLKGEVQKGKI